jgi:hypothetical protein
MILIQSSSFSPYRNPPRLSSLYSLTPFKSQLFPNLVSMIVYGNWGVGFIRQMTDFGVRL